MATRSYRFNDYMTGEPIGLIQSDEYPEVGRWIILPDGRFGQIIKTFVDYRAHGETVWAMRIEGEVGPDKTPTPLQRAG